MNLRIQSQGLHASATLTAVIANRLEHALRNHLHEVVSVDVYLKDLNGPKGGDDKSVRVRVHFNDRVSVLAKAKRSSLLAAIVVAARRIKRSAERAKSRQVAFRRAPLMESAGPVS
jgi:putative sigma-54 modulation protein